MTKKLLTALLIKTGRIQSRIDNELKARAPNWLTVVRLKKIRLQLMDRLYRMIAGERQFVREIPQQLMRDLALVPVRLSRNPRQKR